MCVGLGGSRVGVLEERPERGVLKEAEVLLSSVGLETIFLSEPSETDDKCGLYTDVNHRVIRCLAVTAHSILKGGPR